MNYTSLFEDTFSQGLGMLTSCAATHGDPFLYTNLLGDIGGANQLLLNLFGSQDIKTIAPIDQWLQPQGLELTYILSNSGEYRGKVIANAKTYEMIIRTEVFVLGNEFVIAIVLRDTSALETGFTCRTLFRTIQKEAFDKYLP